MNQTEVGPLGLPRQFSPDQDQRQIQLVHALKVGYETIARKLGKGAANKWEPTGINLVIAQSKVEFLDLVSEGEKDPEAYRRGLSEVTPHGWTSYRTRKIFINGNSIKVPLQAAEIMAHETIHAWAGKQAVRFVRMTAAGDFEGRADILEHLEDRANESLVDYCAMEGLGLLRAPITRMDDVDMLTRARSALMIQELAKGLGSKPEAKIFQITQGAFQAKEIAQINARLGRNPINPSDGNFYDYGFLAVVAFMKQYRDKALLSPKEVTGRLVEAMAWVSYSTRQLSGNLEFLGRSDAVAAERIIKASQ